MFDKEIRIKEFEDRGRIKILMSKSDGIFASGKIIVKERL